MRALNQRFSQVEADEGGNQIYLYENVTDYYFIAALHTVFFFVSFSEFFSTNMTHMLIYYYLYCNAIKLLIYYIKAAYLYFIPILTHKQQSNLNY